MGSAEGGAVVEQEAAIAHVHGGPGDTDSFSKRPADGKVERGVPLQMGRDVAGPVGEPRSVIQISTRRDPVRKIEIEPGVERVALVVIQQEVAVGGRREVGETSGDRAPLIVRGKSTLEFPMALWSK